MGRSDPRPDAVHGGHGERVLPPAEFQLETCLSSDTVAVSVVFNEEEHMRILLTFGCHL